MVYVSSRMEYKSHYALVFYYLENYFRNNYLKIIVKKNGMLK